MQVLTEGRGPVGVLQSLRCTPDGADLRVGSTVPPRPDTAYTLVHLRHRRWEVRLKGLSMAEYEGKWGIVERLDAVEGDWKARVRPMLAIAMTATTVAVAGEHRPRGRGRHPRWH